MLIITKEYIYLHINHLQTQKINAMLKDHECRTRVTELEKQQHQNYLNELKIQDCKKHIDFYIELLNTDKLTIEQQRRILYLIEEQELIILKTQTSKN